MLYFYKMTYYENKEEQQYLLLLKDIIDNGDIRQTRNAKTYSVFGKRLEFDLSNGFPLLTTKKVFVRGIIEELLFFLNGYTFTKILEDKKVMIWHDNTTNEFIKNNNKNLVEYDMGPMYGFQWRHYGDKYEGYNKEYTGGIDQLKNVVELLLQDPYSRRILMTTYNVSQVDEGVLYPCHGLTVQFYVEKNNRISLQMYQRSSDSILGLPFNIASYAVLLHIIVKCVNDNVERTHKEDYNVGRLIIVLGDTHIYEEHLEVAKIQINRMNETYKFPEIKINKKIQSVKNMTDLLVEDFEIQNYVSHPVLKCKMFA